MKKFTNGSFEWFIGVVEDINDPKEANRVQCRIFGYDTGDTNQLPTGNLAWAIVGMPTTESGISGIGRSPHGLVNGSNVVGFFLDGENHQTPMIIACWAGIPSGTTPTGGGFVDPSGTYPTYKNEPDVSKYARGKLSPTNQLVSSNGIAEPSSARKPKYPKNKTTLTESGHLIELDDSTGAERVLIYHKSGSFLEYHTDGTIVYKSIKSSYDLTANDKFINVGGNATINVGGDAKIAVKGNLNTTVGGNYTLSIGGSMSVKVGSSMTVKSGGSMNYQAGGIMQMKAPMIKLN